MSIFPQSIFPTMQDVADLARSIVDDAYPGLTGTPGEGRILTNDAAFMLPFFNSAFRTLQRKMRVGGCTFPIVDNYQLLNVLPVLNPNPNLFQYISYNGFFDGVNMWPTPKLPNDCLQVVSVSEQTATGNLPFKNMNQSQAALPSRLQGENLVEWRWSQYRINLNGATLPKNLLIEYLQGQPPLNVPPTDFAETSVNIADSTDALAYLIAVPYAVARGAADVSELKLQAADAINDMIAEYVRRQQGVDYSRPSYGDENSGLDTGNWLVW
jgi:hypothetical protein